MAYGWKKSAESDYSDRLTPGYYRVKGKKVVMGKGSGRFTTKNGDPYILLVVENADGAEGSVMFTLSEKAGWTLARWLSACGEDLDAMEAEGVEPRHFGNEDIAKDYLVGAECWVRVTEGKDPKYPSLEPVKEEEVVGLERPATAAAGSGSPPDINLDDIPFGLLIAFLSGGAAMLT